MQAPLDDRRQPDALVRVSVGSDGRPAGAAARARIDRPVAEVWATVADVERFARHLPMVHRVRRDEGRVTFDLKFRIGISSAGFQFTAEVYGEPGRWLELRGVSGEPKDVFLRFELTPLDEGRSCVVEGEGRFDIQSLGWLA